MVIKNSSIELNCLEQYDCLFDYPIGIIRYVGDISLPICFFFFVSLNCIT